MFGLRVLRKYHKVYLDDVSFSLRQSHRLLIEDIQTVYGSCHVKPLHYVSDVLWYLGSCEFRIHCWDAASVQCFSFVVNLGFRTVDRNKCDKKIVFLLL